MIRSLKPWCFIGCLILVMHGVAERFSEWIADCGNPVKYNGFWQPNLFTYEFKRPRLFVRV
ncbi:hypothetical protein Plhal304r1_c002g0005811 [Plasmopara halstedii]